LTLDTVYNLGILYMNQGKLAKAEKMYQRALQGYEKALGIEDTITYIPALNTTWCLSSLFELQADLGKARMMYSKALAGYKKVLEHHHPNIQALYEKLRALDTVAEQEAL